MDHVLLFFSGQHNAPVMIQDKILALIQTWADAFKGKPELDAVQHVYNKLRAQGTIIHFNLGWTVCT